MGINLCHNVSIMIEDNFKLEDKVEVALESPKKKLRIMVGVNTLNAIEQPVYSNHCQFWFRLGRHFKDTVDFVINTPRRMSIDRMRNMTAKLALEAECDYLMFIDDDVIIPIGCLEKMIAADKDIIAGWTIIRGYPYDNMFFKYTDTERNALQVYNKFETDSDGLVKCDAVGFSCALIKCSLLKNIPAPYFVTGPYSTEDVYFCIKAEKFNPDVTIYVDPTIKTSHNLGPEFIDPDNRKHYTEYFKKMFPEAVEVPNSGDRGDDYLKLVENA